MEVGAPDLPEPTKHEDEFEVEQLLGRFGPWPSKTSRFGKEQNEKKKIMTNSGDNFYF